MQNNKNEFENNIENFKSFLFSRRPGTGGGKGNEKFIDFAEKLFNPKREKNYIEISWRGREPKQI